MNTVPNPKRTSATYLMLMARVLFFSPLTGAAIGCIVAFVAFNSGAFWGLSQTSLPFRFTSSYGIPFGGVVGGLCGTLAFWPLRHIPLGRVTLFLCGGTLSIALPAAMTGNAGPVLGFGGAVLGFWLGFCFLYFDTPEPQTGGEQSE